MEALISKIKELKKIQPDKEWLAFSRLELQKNMAADAFVAEKTFTFVLKFFGQPMVAVLSIVVFLAGSGFVVAKEARDSLPGDRLYPLKIVMERAEIKVTTNEMAKTRLEAEITGRRASELTKISNLPTFPAEDKTQKVKEAMDQIDQQLSATAGLKEKIESVQNQNSKEAADTAIAVKENTEKLKAAIAEAKERLSEIPENKDLSEKISDISDRLDKTHMEISEIIESIEELQGEVERTKDENIPTTAPVIVPVEQVD